MLALVVKKSYNMRANKIYSDKSLQIVNCNEGGSLDEPQ